MNFNFEKPKNKSIESADTSFSAKAKKIWSKIGRTAMPYIFTGASIFLAKESQSANPHMTDEERMEIKKEMNHNNLESFFAEQKILEFANGLPMQPSPDGGYKIIDNIIHENGDELVVRIDYVDDVAVKISTRIIETHADGSKKIITSFDGGDVDQDGEWDALDGSPDGYKVRTVDKGSHIENMVGSFTFDNVVLEKTKIGGKPAPSETKGHILVKDMHGKKLEQGDSLRALDSANKVFHESVSVVSETITESSDLAQNNQ